MTDETRNQGPAPSDDELRTLTRLARAARETPSVGAPLGFSARVMAQIEAESSGHGARRDGLLARLAAAWHRPLIRLASGLAVAALALWVARATLLPSAPSAPSMAPQQATNAASTIPHRFVLDAPEARRVCLVGDFNGWEVCEVPLVHDESEGTWSVQVELPPGRHEYMFVVDDGWVTDPSADLQVDDGFGNRNAVIFL